MAHFKKKLTKKEFNNLTIQEQDVLNYLKERRKQGFGKGYLYIRNRKTKRWTFKFLAMMTLVLKGQVKVVKKGKYIVLFELVH